jgi:WhiB family redox-sensing transcriptional regulator
LREWRDRAACRDAPPETFFPETVSDPRVYLRRVRETYCGPCPVLIGCAQHALTAGERHGIWASVWVGQNNRSRALVQLRDVAAGKPMPDLNNGGGNRWGQRPTRSSLQVESGKPLTQAAPGALERQTGDLTPMKEGLR